MNLVSLSKRFGSQEVLKDFSLSLPETGRFCLFGPSGCGKTTLLRLLAGLEKPDSGCIRGLERKKTAFVFQEHRLFPWMTVEENVAAVLPRDRKNDAKEWIDRAGLTGSGDKKPHQLSGGMKKRAALARALAYGGDVLLLDEPFQGLDQKAMAELCNMVLQYNTAPLVFLVTHHPEEAKKLSDEVLLAQGPPFSIVKQVKTADWQIPAN